MNEPLHSPLMLLVDWPLERIQDAQGRAEVPEPVLVSLDFGNLTFS